MILIKYRGESSRTAEKENNSRHKPRPGSTPIRHPGRPPPPNLHHFLGPPTANSLEGQWLAALRVPEIRQMMLTLLVQGKPARAGKNRPGAFAKKPSPQLVAADSCHGQATDKPFVKPRPQGMIKPSFPVQESGSRPAASSSSSSSMHVVRSPYRCVCVSPFATMHFLCKASCNASTSYNSTGIHIAAGWRTPRSNGPNHFACALPFALAKLPAHRR